MFIRIKNAGLIVVMAVAALATTTPVMGWGIGHRHIREWAVTRLPDWQQQFFGTDNLRRLCVDYKSLQDQYTGSKDPKLAPYCVTPGVKHRLHDVHKMEPSIISIQWLLQNIVDNLRAGEHDEAMKFLGVLCHWNEDPGSPSAHATDLSESRLRSLLPEPSDEIAERLFIFGYKWLQGMDAKSINLDPDEPHTPQLLGVTIDEVAGRIYQHQRLLERHAQSCILPAVLAKIEGDEERFKRYIDKAAIYNGKHVADIIYTVGCLAADRFESPQVEATAVQQLADWLPTNWIIEQQHRIGRPPYSGLPFLVNRSFTPDRKMVPLQLVGIDGDIEKGFGVGHGKPVEFSIRPGRIFNRLQTTVGLHPSAGEQGRATFELVVNGETLATVGPLSGTDAGQTIDVDLPDADQLDIVLSTTKHDDAPVSHIVGVWAEPVLFRSAAP